MDEYREIPLPQVFSTEDLRSISLEPILEPVDPKVKAEIEATVGKWRQAVGDSAAQFVQYLIQFEKPGLVNSPPSDKDKSMLSHCKVFNEILSDDDALNLWSYVTTHKERLIRDTQGGKRTDLNKMILFCVEVEKELSKKLIQQVATDGKIEMLTVSENPGKAKVFIERGVARNLEAINEAKTRGSAQGISEVNNLEMAGLGQVMVNLMQATKSMAGKFPNLY